MLWGKGGRGKTQSARCIAKHFAIGHGSLKYVSTDNVDALKVVQHEFAEYVTIVLEELRTGGLRRASSRASEHWWPRESVHCRATTAPQGSTRCALLSVSA